MVGLEPLALSLVVALVATVLAAVVGLGLALALGRLRHPLLREVLDGILTAPMVMPPTVLGYALLVALGRRSFLGSAWEQVVGSPLVFSRAGAVLAAFVAATPLIVRSSRAALDSVDERLVGVARTLGASETRAIVTILLPLAWRGIFAGILLGFARALGDFGITLMVAGDLPGETQTASLAIYDALMSGRQHEASVMAVTLGGLAVVVLVVAGRLGSSGPRQRETRS
jgi:molybdate transport system permease protein